MTDFRTQLVRLLQNPKVADRLSDPRVRDGLMTLLRFRSRVSSALDDGLERAARAMNLATKRDVRELKRTIRRLEEQLRQRDGGSNGAGPEHRSEH